MDLGSRGSDGLAGRLRIGAMESTASTRLPPLVADYHARWPRVDLEISVGTSASLIDDVRDGRIDCAFVVGLDAAGSRPSNSDSRRAKQLRDLGATYAYTEELLLVLPASHPQVRAADDIAIPAMAVFPEGCTYRRVLEQWLASTASERDWDVVVQTSYHGILTSVAAGCCIALCPRSVIDAQHTMPYVRTHSLSTIDIYLIARANAVDAAYAEFVRAVRRASLASGQPRRLDALARFEVSAHLPYVTFYPKPDQGETR